jgi:hypothetical protein
LLLLGSAIKNLQPSDKINKNKEYLSMQATSWHLLKLVRFRILAFTLLIVCSQFYTTRAGATLIDINLGGSPKITSGDEASFTDLNGTAFQGQTLSLDFSISNGKFVRLFSATSSTFDIQIILQTNGASQVGFLDGTGHLVDSQGIAIPGFGVTGSASGNDLLTIGLFPLLKDKNGTPNDDLPRPLDFFGVHFDLILPNNPSVTITNGDFALVSDPGAPFGIGPGVPRDIVPDTGSTFLFLTLSVSTLMVFPQVICRVIPLRTNAVKLQPGRHQRFGIVNQPRSERMGIVRPEGVTSINWSALTGEGKCMAYSQVSACD